VPVVVTERVELEGWILLNVPVERFITTWVIVTVLPPPAEDGLAEILVDKAFLPQEG